MTPRGDRVSGDALLAASVRFGRELRSAGLAIDLGAAIDFARALALVDIGQREVVWAAGSAVFVRRHDDLPTYDAVFERFWRRRGLPLGAGGPSVPPRPEQSIPADDGDAEAEGAELTLRRSVADPAQLQGASQVEGEETTDIEGFVIAPDAYSAGEVIRHTAFDRMTAAELRDAERFIDLLTPRLEQRRTRRHELHPHGRRLAPRAMFRRNLAVGGDLATWVWQRPIRRPRPIVVLCDISGSMERHSRLLLRFVQALAASNAVRTEAFVFGTRLTRVTRVLRDRDRDRALSLVADSVSDWAGGTRIGESFRSFNLRWARRVLRTSGVVIVASDGWDRGDPGLVAEETARLRRNCHRLIWLNPLAGMAGYQPLAAGMAAAYPFIDDFVAAGTLASLERLAELLAQGAPGRGGGKARPHVTGVGGAPNSWTVLGAAASAARPASRAPRPLRSATGDRSVARPLSQGTG
jgi:uncharacterized protein with von Willebrand factor type A (vWA) domain